MPSHGSYGTVTPASNDKLFGTDVTDGTSKNFLPSALPVSDATQTALNLKANLAGGNVFTGIQDLSANGAYFGAAAASNLLTDYEEGTWTPNFAVGSGSVDTYAIRAGSYTKIGRQVTICGYISLTGVTTPGGALTITGLPFTIGANDIYRTSPSFACDNLTGINTDQLLGEGIPNTSTIAIYSGGATTLGYTVGANLANNSNLRFFMSYFV